MTRDLDTEGLMTCCPWRACLIRICPFNPRKEARDGTTTQMA